jgi:hypothetical protein
MSVPTAPPDETLSFSSDTNLQALADAHGHRYARSADDKEEYVIREDGTILIRAFRVPPNLRGEKRKGPNVWMRSLRYHTYQGKPQDDGAIYLAYDADVETILNLKFAVRDTPPPKATR